MDTVKDGVVAPDSVHVRSEVGRQLSPVALVVAALVCALVAAVFGSMLVGPAAAAGHSAKLPVSGLAGAALP